MSKLTKRANFKMLKYFLIKDFMTFFFQAENHFLGNIEDSVAVGFPVFLHLFIILPLGFFQNTWRQKSWK